MSQIILSDRHRRILVDVLAPYRDRFEGVAVFGSRATGRARPNSDIDLVFFGDVSRRDQVSIWGDLEDSDLPVTVDLVWYRELTDDRLRDHIDRLALPLNLDPALDQVTSVAAE